MFTFIIKVEEMKAEGVTAIQATQNINLDPDIYLLSI